MLQLKIEAIKWETPDTATFFLSEISGEKVGYLAGQFITLIFQHHQTEIRRSYSLSSAPYEDLLSITVKRIPNGEISRFLLSKARVGDVLSALEPMGKFTLPGADVTGDVFCFAGGAGITPIYSHIKFLLSLAIKGKILLIYSAQNPAATIFYAELNALAAKHPNQFKLFYLFSEGISGRGGSRLNIESAMRLVEQNLGWSKAEAIFFICGPFSYMRMVQLTLTFMGFASRQIRKENFRADIEPNKKATITYPPKKIGLKFGGIYYQIPVAQNQTILDAALQKGIQLPYSCKAGICSSCTAICSSGKVEMQVNDVLTDDDLKKRWILTCTGHPVSDDLVIEFP